MDCSTDRFYKFSRSSNSRLTLINRDERLFCSIANSTAFDSRVKPSAEGKYITAGCIMFTSSGYDRCHCYRIMRF